jgi:hypothetical protein
MRSNDNEINEKIIPTADYKHRFLALMLGES